jgi:hypothetical protein
MILRLVGYLELSMETVDDGRKTMMREKSFDIKLR